MNKAHHVHATFLRAGALALALFGVSLSHAQTVGGDGSIVNFPNRVTGGTTEFQSLIAKAENVNKFSLAVDPSGKINATGAARLANGATVSVGAAASKTAVAAAVGRFALKAVPLLGTGVALWDLANELDYKLLNTAGTAPTVQKYTVAGCSSSCFEYASPATGSAPWFPSVAASCASTVGTSLSGGYVYNVVSATQTGVAGGNGCTLNQTGSYGANHFVPVGTRSIAPFAPGGLVPSTVAELENAIAAKSGWPSGSALARTIAEALRTGDAVELQPYIVTGPATSAGPVTTSTASGGNVTTNTTTNNYNYAGNKVTNTQSTVTSTYNPGTGVTTTDKTDTAPAPDPQKSQCEQFPQSVGCAELDTPTAEIPRSTATITYAAETPFGDGACPASVSTFVVTLNKTVTPWDWSKACTMVLPVRAMVILLATFSAFLIVMPARVSV